MSNVKVLSYPANFPGPYNAQTNPAGHQCPGCLGTKGDCTLSVASQQDVVAFGLADGRSGSVTVVVGASNAVIVSAIQAWAMANPLTSMAITGTAIT